MPSSTGERFSSASMADCAFCPSDGRRFRTARQCAGCSRALCLNCRPEIPGKPYLCPDCGGGPREDALHVPAASITRLEAAGERVPYWLLVAREALASKGPVEAEELIIPE
ncbi:MAG: hypothetical protein ACK47B_21010 [Armatimonadota bacterium]